MEKSTKSPKEKTYRIDTDLLWFIIQGASSPSIRWAGTTNLSAFIDKDEDIHLVGERECLDIDIKLTIVEDNVHISNIEYIDKESTNGC
tara:strand:- start:31 stop:297 length:267 start_codon:yes stop_codon:yes gene_type:complete